MSPREATHYPAPYWSFGRHKMVEMVHVVFCVALLVLVAMLCEVGGGWGEGVETERLKREREREKERTREHAQPLFTRTFTAAPAAFGIPVARKRI